MPMTLIFKVRYSRDMYEDKNKVAVMYSERKKRLQSAGKKKKKSVKKKPTAIVIVTETEMDEEEIQRDKEKMKKLKSVVDELSQPHRYCEARLQENCNAVHIFSGIVRGLIQ